MSATTSKAVCSDNPDNHVRVCVSRQVFTLYTLASRQLSKQSHYDFGLRGLIGLLRYAGLKKRMFPDMGDEEVSLLKGRDGTINVIPARGGGRKVVKIRRRKLGPSVMIV